MISTREKVATHLSALTEAQLCEVAEYLEFLRFREYRKIDSQFDEANFESLYAEFADEDRELAGIGLAEYSASLDREDAAR